MRSRSISAALVAALLLAGCGQDRSSPATATADPSPSRSAEPAPEHDPDALAGAVRRAAAGLGTVKEVTPPGYEPGVTSTVQMALCDTPRPLNGGYGTPVNVRSFFSVVARTRPTVYRSGGQRAEALGELRVAAVRPGTRGGPEYYFDALRAQKCTGGSVHRVDVPSPGAIAYRSATGTAQVGGAPRRWPPSASTPTSSTRAAPIPCSGTPA